MFDFIFEKILAPLFLVLLILLLLFLFFGLPYLIWFAPKAETFSLRVDEWSCIQSHTETTTTYIMVGKVMVPSVSSHQVCDVYGRTDK